MRPRTLETIGVFAVVLGGLVGAVALILFIRLQFLEGVSEPWRTRTTVGLCISLTVFTSFLAISAKASRIPKWLMVPLFPFAYSGMLLFIFPALLFMFVLGAPYYTLYPERHAQLWDATGTPRQRERLAKWRAHYERLTIWQRMARAWKLEWRRRGRSRCMVAEIAQQDKSSN